MVRASVQNIAPEIAERLDEQAAQFERDGMIVIENAVPLEIIERIGEATDRIVDKLDRPGRWMGKAVSMQRRIEYRGLYHLDDAFLELLAPPMVFPLIVRLMGPNIHMISSQLLYGVPNQEPRPHVGSWHRDLVGSSEDLGYDNTPRLAIRAGYYLSDVSEPESGITLFVPGSHKLKAPLEVPRGNRDPESWFRPKMKPGDAVIWENRCFHAPEPNTSPNVRKAVMIQYGYRWVRPQDYIDHPPDLLEKCDPVARQLLSSHDIEPDGSITRMKGARALKEWAIAHGLDRAPDPRAAPLEPQ